MIRLLLITLIAAPCTFVYGQLSPNEKGTFSGNLLMNNQYYMRDDRIGANTKVYKTASNSVDAWLFMNYRIHGFNFTLRYDLFNNSPLLNPQDAYSNHGIGFWQIQKKVDELDITVGSFYDQFGSGALFRAYEQRGLGVDYAVQGIRLTYDLSSNWRIKGFSGQQKGNINNRFGFAPQIITGGNIEGRIGLGKDEKWGSLDVGASAVGRLLDKTTMDELVAEINNYPISSRFYPTNSVYGFNGYFTWSIGNLVWNVEANYKTHEAIRNLDNSLFRSEGKVLISALSWGKGGIGKKKRSFGVNAQFRHVDRFSFRTSPNELLLNGMITYLPSLTRLNTYRLLARYNAPAQELGENGGQIEADIRWNKKTLITLNGSYVRSLKSNGINNQSIRLFREYYAEVLKTLKKGSKLKLGFQSIAYNQARYEQEPEYEDGFTYTPFAEYTVNFKGDRSLRVEAQYLKTDKDQGSFANLMVEYFFNNRLSVAVGDMVNTEPHRYKNMIIANEILHYPTVFASYNHKNSIFTLAYLKQQQGVNCSGGVCRIEPAFSGVRLTVSTNF